MKELGLKSIIVKKYNHNGNKKVDDTNKKNLLEQNFKAERPSEKYERISLENEVIHSYVKKGIHTKMQVWKASMPY